MRIPLLLASYCLAVPAIAGLLMVYDASRENAALHLLNVSYDPTRELWRAINSHFIADYEREAGVRVGIQQSHGGSASQARSVLDGMRADVVTLALWSDTDVLRERGLLSEHWEDALPYHSLPYFSTIVFVVRAGNPKHIRDWPDLIRTDVEVVTPNPKTSGNGKLSFLAGWGSVKIRGGTDDEALAFVTKLYQRVPILDTGARGAATTFAQNGRGDVHLTWENEAYLERHESGDVLEVVYPPVSIRAEPPVAVVDSVVDAKGTRGPAEAYLKYLFRPSTQELIAQHYFRPIVPAVLAKCRDRFPELELFPITVIADDWHKAQERFFAGDGIFDRIYANKNAGQ